MNIISDIYERIGRLERAIEAERGKIDNIATDAAILIMDVKKLGRSTNTDVDSGKEKVREPEPPVERRNI